MSETSTTKNVATTEAITGGTGRFAGAHGETTTKGQTVLSPDFVQTYTFRFTGTITKRG